MAIPIQPLEIQSIKDAVVRRMEALILSGEFTIGQRLPAERDLALRLGVSRPVLHEALVELSSRGLVTIESRRGVFISDYRVRGSPAILASLLSYNNGKLEPALMQSLLDMRLLFESETARLAALNRKQEDLAEFRRILEEETNVRRDDPAGLTQLDFSFHLQVALSSANHIYPLIMNSFRDVYTGLTGAFFSQNIGSTVIDKVHGYHQLLFWSIENRDSQAAGGIMREMLRHGEDLLLGH